MTEVYSATENPQRWQAFCAEQAFEELDKLHRHLVTAQRWVALGRASLEAEEYKKGEG